MFDITKHHENQALV